MAMCWSEGLISEDSLCSSGNVRSNVVHDVERFPFPATLAHLSAQVLQRFLRIYAILPMATPVLRSYAPYLSEKLPLWMLGSVYVPTWRQYLHGLPGHVGALPLSEETTKAT